MKTSYVRSNIINSAEMNKASMVFSSAVAIVLVPIMLIINHLSLSEYLYDGFTCMIGEKC